jgi:transcription elongation factor Elf1
MKRKIIACIFCGKIADITKKGELRFVSCSNCNKETELGTYQELFDQWVDEKRKTVYAKKIMDRD